MYVTSRLAAAIVVIGILGASDAGAQERATVSPINLSNRYVGALPQAVRGSVRQPDWVIAPNLRWPVAASHGSEPVSVTSECSVSKAGSLRNCHIVGESVTNREFEQAFLRALENAKVGPSSVPNEGIVYRTTATFDPRDSD